MVTKHDIKTEIFSGRLAMGRMIAHSARRYAQYFKIDRRDPLIILKDLSDVNLEKDATNAVASAAGNQD